MSTYVKCSCIVCLSTFSKQKCMGKFEVHMSSYRITRACPDKQKLELDMSSFLSSFYKPEKLR